MSLAENGSFFNVETTKRGTAEPEGKKWPVQLRFARSIDSKRTWIFTDGSGTGWHAAVVVRPGIEEHRVTACIPTSTKNVGAELDGVILGLEHSLPRERIVIVSDYLWSVYYVNGWRQVHEPYVRERVARARAILQEKELSPALFIHHSGHQDDDSDFSRWNNVVDQLCRKGCLTDFRIPVSERAERVLQKQQGKGNRSGDDNTCRQADKPDGCGQTVWRSRSSAKTALS